MPNISPDWALDFAPELGGCLTNCSYQGHQILRAANAPTDPRHAAAFPMVPFIGRINRGRFTFNGEQIALTPNMPPDLHAIHGRGWQSSWQMQQDETGKTTLWHDYDGNADWPWSYRAEQVFTAQNEALTLHLSLTNTSHKQMPAGLGWHPYFPKAGAQIHADVTSVWAGTEKHIIGNSPQPLSPETDLRGLRDVHDLALDHCFTAGENGTVLTWPERNLSLTITASAPLRHLTVYTPPGEDYFCVEPVSHAPDTVNSILPANMTGLRVLEPDETLSAEIALTVGKI